MATVVITIKDIRGGGINVKATFSPALLRGELMTPAKATGLKIMEALGGRKMEVIKSAMALKNPK